MQRSQGPPLADPKGFIIDKGGNLIWNNPPGNITLVMFSNTLCGYCKDVIPVMMELNARDKRIAYAIVNVDKALSDRSKATSTPILSTPTFFVYVRNQPYLICGKKNRTVEYFRGVITKVLSEVGSVPNKERPVARPEYEGKPQTRSGGGGGGGGGPIHVNENEGMRMDIPNFLAPHNQPWQPEYRKLDGQ